MLNNRVEMEVVAEYLKDVLEMEKGRLASFFSTQFIWEKMTARICTQIGLAELYGLNVLDCISELGW